LTAWLQTLQWEKIGSKALPSEDNDVTSKSSSHTRLHAFAMRAMEMVHMQLTLAAACGCSKISMAHKANTL